MEHVKDLVILITAGASGIGSVIARILSQADAKVIICDNDQEAIDKFSKNNSTITTFNTDVSNEEQVTVLFKELKEQFGTINCLINNAGIAGPSAKLEDTKFEEWQSTLNVNLNSSFLCTKSSIPLFRSAGGGSIINIGSTSSFLGTPLRSPYSATKWGLIGLTKTWAMEYGMENIRINTICPGSVNGERIEQVIDRESKYRNVTSEEIKVAYLNQTSMQVFIDAEEIAGMIVYLLSPLAKNITGQMLIIDGHTENLSMINKEKN